MAVAGRPLGRGGVQRAGLLRPEAPPHLLQDVHRVVRLSAEAQGALQRHLAHKLFKNSASSAFLGNTVCPRKPSAPRRMQTAERKEGSGRTSLTRALTGLFLLLSRSEKLEEVGRVEKRRRTDGQDLVVVGQRWRKMNDSDGLYNKGPFATLLYWKPEKVEASDVSLASHSSSYVL